MTPDDYPNERSTTETIRDVAESGKQVFEAGQRIVGDLQEIEQRAERAADWRMQYDHHPAMFLSAAFVGGLILSTLVTPRRA